MHSRMMLFLAASAAVFVIGCAQMRSISGGEKDTLAPRITMLFPDSLSTNFTAQSFEVSFDEYIQLVNINQQLLISPPLKKSPKVRLHQRTMRVSWEDTLAANTTYTFQFGNGIADINEGNALKDFSYVFSTGSYIDSLTLEGKVVDAMTNLPVKDCKVFLFDSLQHVFNKDERPVYFARTNDQGLFRLKYLRAGSYLLCALSDENANYHYDSPEGIAWKEQVDVFPEGDSVGHTLWLSVPRDTSWTVKEYRTDSLAGMRFYVEPWMKDIGIKSANELAIVQWQRNDTLYAAPAQSNVEEVVYEVLLRPGKRDTVSCEYESTFRGSFPVIADASAKLRVGDNFLLTAGRVVKIADTTRIELFQDSVIVPHRVADCYPDGCVVGGALRPGSSYLCRILPGLFEDTAGQTNDTLELKFVVYEPKDLGTIRIQLPDIDSEFPWILSLRDRGNRVVWSSAPAPGATLLIRNIVPGEYNAILTEDRNANGIFDPLNITPFQATELNHAYPGSISVRANWDLEINWPDWSKSR